MNIRKGMRVAAGKFETDKEGVLEARLRVGKESWEIKGVYMNKNMEKVLENLGVGMKDREEGLKRLIVGDFNARTGEEGGGIDFSTAGDKEEKEEGKRIRKSKDKTQNIEGRRLVSFLEEKGWGIYNGCIKGDEEGEFTFTGGRGNSVIDYLIGEEETRDHMRIGERVESDHQPLEIRIKGERGGKGGRRGEKRGDKKWRRGIWNEEVRKGFVEKLGEWEEVEKGLEEDWRGMERKIKEALEEGERIGKEKEKRRLGWRDRECEEKKREVRRELRKWRKGRGSGEGYRRIKREYKRLCEEKRKVENERWEREAMEVRRENEVWDLINRERKKGRRVNEEIGMGEWEDYFRSLLGEVEERVVRGGERRRREGKGEGNQEQGIQEKEIKRIRRAI